MSGHTSVIECQLCSSWAEKKNIAPDGGYNADVITQRKKRLTNCKNEKEHSWYHSLKIYWVEAVDLSFFKLCLENYEFCEHVKFGAVSWKFDICL